MSRYYVNWTEAHSYLVEADSKEDAIEKVGKLKDEGTIGYDDTWEENIDIIAEEDGS